MKVYETFVNCSYEPPVSSAFLSAIRNSKSFRANLVVERAGDNFNISLHKDKELVASCSLDFFYHENFVDSSKGPIYLDIDLLDIREKLYSLI